ncbi:hypothetical protein NQZ68_031347 [Dissostichus eleginoides]|nr:hypothetical protein NQZ68_031347 [Dissostichus eleginoides]
MSHLCDHNYSRTEPSSSQSTTTCQFPLLGTWGEANCVPSWDEQRPTVPEKMSSPVKTEVSVEAGRRRKRQRRGSRDPEEPPQRRLREGSPSPLPSTPTPPQAMLEDVRLKVQETQPGPLPEPVEGPQPDGATALPLLSEPSGLSPTDFDAVSERIMAWMSHTIYSREL